LPVHETSDSILDSLQDARTAQPALTLVRRRDASFESLLDGLGDNPLIVVAHAIQDPGNLGSIMRSSDAAGADAFLVAGDGADLHHPRAVRATMGSIFRLPAAAADAKRLVEGLRRRNIRTLAADNSALLPYHEADLARPTALFFGSESDGLPARLLSALDEAVVIPMRNGVESLSVGAAAAVLLFEAARQRGSSGDRGAG
jgi:TrmH family RNA methyltransferase